MAGGPLEPAQLSFGPYYLAGPTGPLTKDGVVVPLRPKACCLLWTIARHGGEVVPKETLFDVVWPKTIVVESSLNYQINRLRVVLRDDPRNPRYVATVHRIGYRFVAPVYGSDAVMVPRAAAPQSAFVGRERELGRLDVALERAMTGHRQSMMISGRAGIGKSALIGHFLSGVAPARKDLLVLTGQCVLHVGEREAWLPILDALGRLGRRKAVPPLDFERVPGRSTAASPDLVQRELVDALEFLGTRNKLLLVIEDLQAADTGTLELLTLLTQRMDPCRLLVVGTYRPESLPGSPDAFRRFRHDFLLHHPSCELRLEGLAAAPVGDHLRDRFGAAPRVSTIAGWVQRRSEGHPLLMTQLADLLALRADPMATTRREIDEALPADSLQLIDAHLRALPDAHQRILEAGALEGPAFTVAAVAAALDGAVDEIEGICEAMASESRFIRDVGVARWPDGTTSGRYAFLHAMEADVLRRRIGSARAVRWHRRLAARKTSAFGLREPEIAADLAAHHAAAGDAPEEVRLRLLAARQAQASGAIGEARKHADRAGSLMACVTDRDLRGRLVREHRRLAGRLQRGPSPPGETAVHS